MSGLTDLETRFFSFVLSRKKTSVQTGEVQAALAITPNQEGKLFSRLADRQMIARVRRGLYLVPSQIPAGSAWSPSEALALATLMNDQKGRFQISGPSAFSRYGWDEQIPNRTFVYNNRLSGERTVGANEFTLIKVSDDRLGAVEKVKTPDKVDLVYSSKSRALVDAVYDWSRFNTLPRAYEWITRELSKDDAFASRLVEATLRFGNQGAIRRIGRLLDVCDSPRPLLRKLERELGPTTSFIPWVPSLPKRGTIDRRWMILVNNA